MSFGMISKNKNMEKKQNYVTWIVHIKRDHLYSDIAKNVKATFNTCNYELDRPLPKEESIKESGLMKDEFLY